MRPQLNPMLMILTGACACAGVTIVACGVNRCEGTDSGAVVQVGGTYDYSGESAFSLKGTITFEQQDLLVRVIDTTYANSNDRALRSEFAPLDGNTLVLKLTPQNGDTNYEANVTFVFGAGGTSFCAEFSDTNGDTGALGSYTGVKQ